MEKKTTELYGGQGIAARDIWAEVAQAVETHRIPLRDVLESFAIYARRINITRFLAHYELYKMVQDVPGCIVECGVYQGNSLFAFAKFLEIFSPGDRIRQVIGFDSFRGFESFSPEDGPEYPNRSKVLGGWNPESFKECFYKFLDIYHADQFVPHAKRVFVIEGDVTETIPLYLKQNPGLRVSLLHLDIDLYKPTLTALEHLYPLVVPGGLVVLDEYGMTEWGGESKAFEQYFGSQQPVMKKFPWTSTPGGYFIKGQNP